MALKKDNLKESLKGIELLLMIIGGFLGIFFFGFFGYISLNNFFDLWATINFVFWTIIMWKYSKLLRKVTKEK